MKQAKEYVHKHKSVVVEYILAVLMALVVIFAIIKVYIAPLALLLIIPIPCTILYFQIYVVTIIKQFNLYDYGKRLIINEDRTTLTYFHQNKTVIVNQVDVVRVEIYEQTDLGKFGKYDYMVIYTNLGEQIVITNLTVPSLVYDKIMEMFLKKVPRVYFKKQFNFIDEAKFKP